MFEVENKLKRLPLCRDAPVYILPIKATHMCCLNEQVHYMKHGKTAAVVGRPYFQVLKGPFSSGRHNLPLWRVLLDSGSNGDILFQKKDKKTKYSTVRK